MARDDVELVKQKTDIVAVIGEHVDLKKAGSNFKGLCPFHSEKLPSFMVSPELQIYKCFGCSKSGDVYTFLQEYEGMDFVEALRFLASRAGVELKQTRTPKSNKKQIIFAVNKSASYFYNWVLTNHPSGKNALDYLSKERGLKKATIKTFGLGFSPPESGALVSYLIDKKKFKQADLEAAGLVYRRGRGVVGRFRNRVIFPLSDARGNVIGFAGRTMPGAKTDMAKYINSPETPVYHKSGVLYGLNATKGDIKRQKFAIVVEGELDLISPWQIGIKNIVAIKGSAFTDEQATLISRYANRVVLAYDADNAGIKAMVKGALVAQSAGLEVNVARLTSSKDPDSLARENPEKLKKILSNTVGVWDFLIDTVFSKHNLNTSVGKARASREVVPILANIDDAIVQSHFVKVVADKLKVTQEAVVAQLERTGKTVNKESEDSELKETRSMDRKEMLENRLLFLIFRGVANRKKLNMKGLITNPLNKKLFNHFKDYTAKNRTFNASKFSKALPSELAEGFSSVYLKDERLGSSRETQLVVKELKLHGLKSELDSVAKDIAKLEKMGQKGKLRRAQLKFRKISGAISQIKDK